MENKKYSNFNNSGKQNNQANFSITFASTTKFVNKKVQRPGENSALKISTLLPSDLPI